MQSAIGCSYENTNGPFGFNTRCTCRNSRADVVDLGDRVGAERRVDRLGAEEGEVGEVTLAPLDLHLFVLGTLAGMRETSVGAVERDHDRTLRVRT